MIIEKHIEENRIDLQNQMDRLFGRTDLTTNETNSIYNCLEKFPEPSYLEIGVYFGGTFAKVLKFLQSSGKKHFCTGLDLFEDLLLYEENYNNRFQSGIKSQTHVVFHEFNVDEGGKEGGRLNVSVRQMLFEKLIEEGFNNFELLKGDSDKSLKEIDKRFDVIFIDGNHSYEQTKSDFFNCFESLSKVGTYFIFHNTTKQESETLYLDGGPFLVCQELLSFNELELVGIFDTITIFKRIKV